MPPIAIHTSDGSADAAMNAAREGTYIEIIAGRMDLPKNLSFARTRIKELYGDMPASVLAKLGEKVHVS
jgi:hypothetical protein